MLDERPAIVMPLTPTIPNTNGLKVKAVATSGDLQFDSDNEGQLMSRQQADEVVLKYRQTLNAWSVAVNSAAPNSGDALYYQLDREQEELAAVALAFPEMSYDVDRLIHFRKAPATGVMLWRNPTAHKSS